MEFIIYLESKKVINKDKETNLINNCFEANQETKKVEKFNKAFF